MTTKYKTIILLVFTVLFSSIITAQSNIISKQEMTVAKDGSGNFTTIQEAINSVNNTSDEKVLIRIRSGIYKEKLIISKSKNNIVFIGEDKKSTKITFDDYSGKIDPITNKKHGTFSSHSVLVEGNDIEFHNITIENSWCEKGQAVALHVEGDRFLISNSNILGCQDTVFTGEKKSNQLYVDCFIEGTTDFIFGPAIAVFKNCTIKSKKNSFITAASTPEDHEFGYIFLHCKLIADGNATKVFLGRPWRPYAKTVFIKCNLGSHIVPVGWDPWIDTRFPNKDKTAYYAEYKSKGEGANPNKRVAWSNQLSKKEAKKYIIQNIFKDCQNWNALDKYK